jgi:hypothetical protein
VGAGLRIVSRLQIITFAVAAILVAAGTWSDIEPLMAAGFLVLGVTALLAGGEALVTGRAFFLPGGPHAIRSRSEYYSGLPARLWGVFFLVAGAGVIVASTFALARPGELRGFIDRALGTPSGAGAGCVVFGAFVSLYGVIRLTGGGAATARSLGMRLRHVGYRVFGALVLLVGVGLIALGARLWTTGDWSSVLPRDWRERSSNRSPASTELLWSRRATSLVSVARARRTMGTSEQDGRRSRDAPHRSGAARPVRRAVSARIRGRRRARGDRARGMGAFTAAGVLSPVSGASPRRTRQDLSQSGTMAPAQPPA